MVEGYLLDHGHLNTKMGTVWVEGPPATSFLSGLSTENRAVFNVQAFRCDDCYFLEFYTTDRVD